MSKDEIRHVTRTMVAHELFRLCYYTPGDNGRGVPAHFEGAPGVAKTAFAAQFARSVGAPFLHLNATMKGEGYFGVVPVPVKRDDGTTELQFPVPAAIHEMNRLGRGIIVFDEYNSTPGNMRAAMLGTLQERVFGDVQLHPGIWVVALSNPVGIGTHATPMSLPESNRFVHFKWPCVSTDEYFQYLQDAAVSWSPDSMRPKTEYGTGLDAQDREVHKKFAAAFSASIVAAKQFMPLCFTALLASAGTKEASKDAENALLVLPTKNAKNTAAPFPSPRSWSNTMRLLATIEILYPADGSVNVPGGVIRGEALQELKQQLQIAVIEGAIGEGVASAFLDWKAEMAVPDMDAWLGSDTAACLNTVEFDVARTDRTLVILESAALHLVSQPPERDPFVKRAAENLWHVLTKAHKQTESAEVVAIAAGHLIRAAAAMNVATRRDYGLMTKVSQDLIRQVLPSAMMGNANAKKK
jgi:MoxR-like ATPase